MNKDLKFAIDSGIEEGDMVRQWCTCGCKKPLTEGEVIFRKGEDGEMIPCIRNYERKEDTPLNMYDEKGVLVKVEIIRKANK